MIVLVTQNLSFYESGECMGAHTADELARLDGCLWAERFVKKYNGLSLVIAGGVVRSSRSLTDEEIGIINKKYPHMKAKVN